ncbi:hypothetical protein BV133_2530 [Blastochloris viridis]|uniref:Uncharacterized protein n=1 Tax=Blastochloris viridis TaxID=1079 RepID=A0A182D4M3_BLAVI|nr:hypothetical protein BV133_2530 [Blastochloris viridis]
MVRQKGHQGLRGGRRPAPAVCIEKIFTELIVTADRVNSRAWSEHGRTIGPF